MIGTSCAVACEAVIGDCGDQRSRKERYEELWCGPLARCRLRASTVI